MTNPPPKTPPASPWTALVTKLSRIRQTAPAWAIYKAPKLVHALAVVAVALGVRPVAEAQTPPPPTPPPTDPGCFTPPITATPAAVALQTGKFADNKAAAPVTAITEAGAPWNALSLVLSPGGSWLYFKRAAIAWMSTTDPTHRQHLTENMLSYIDALKTESFELGPAPLPKVSEALLAILTAKTFSDPAPFTKLLDEMEAVGAVDGWIVGWIFYLIGPQQNASLSAADAAPIAALFGRLESHLRNADAIARARFSLGPIEPRPWMSKSAPPRGWREITIPAGFGTEVERVFPDAIAGAWQTETLLPVEVTSAPPGAVLWRRNHPIPLSPGDTFSLTRLDVVVVPDGSTEPLVLKSTAGTLTIPTNQAMTTWNALRFLDDSARAALQAQLELAATRCDPIAQAALHKHLWLSHHLILARLSHPDPNPGAPALRLILALFDQ